MASFTARAFASYGSVIGCLPGAASSAASPTILLVLSDAWSFFFGSEHPTNRRQLDRRKPIRQPLGSFLARIPGCRLCRACSPSQNQFGGRPHREPSRHFLFRLWQLALLQKSEVPASQLCARPDAQKS